MFGLLFSDLFYVFFPSLLTNIFNFVPPYIEYFEVHLTSTPVNETPILLEIMGVGQFPTHLYLMWISYLSDWKLPFFVGAEQLSLVTLYLPSAGGSSECK